MIEVIYWLIGLGVFLKLYEERDKEGVFLCLIAAALWPAYVGYSIGMIVNRSDGK